jgi:glycogen debranching enzyme
LDAAGVEVPAVDTLADLTLVDGRTFAISDLGGDMHRPTHGVIHDDRRHLSHLVIDIAGGWLQTLASTTPSPLSAVTVRRFYEHGANRPSTCVLVRRRLLIDGMREDIELQETGPAGRTVTLRARLGADFAHVFDVKAGLVRPPCGVVPIAGGCEVRADEVQSATRVHWSVPPTSEVTADGWVSWRIDVPPRGKAVVTLLVQPIVDGVAVDLRLVQAVAAEAAVPAERDDAWHRHAPDVTSVDPRLSIAVERSIADLAALRITDRAHPERTLVAAGAPWFMTLFGRDSLLVAWMTLGFDRTLCSGVLRSLGELQGTVADPTTAEEPGKILHELRRHGGGGPFAARSRYYGTVDATALYVALAGEAVRWGALDDDDLAALAAPLRRALTWILHAIDADPHGFVTYRPHHPDGLTNQGWKDSWDGITHRDGSLPDPPIALAEVQGYAFAALRAGAELADAVELGHGRDDLERRADELAARFNERFWNPDGWFALGLEGNGRRIDSLTTNPGHAIWTGIAEPALADAHLERLMSDQLWTGWGIRTLAATMGAYDPLSYHNGSVWPHDTALCAAGAARYGRWDIVDRIVDGALETAAHFDGRPPELFAGFRRADIPTPVHYPASCSPQAWASASVLLLVKVMLGLAPIDSGSGLQSVRPDLSALPDIRLHRLCAGGATVDVEIRGGTLWTAPSAPPA